MTFCVSAWVLKLLRSRDSSWRCLSSQFCLPRAQHYINMQLKTRLLWEWFWRWGDSIRKNWRNWIAFRNVVSSAVCCSLGCLTTEGGKIRNCNNWGKQWPEMSMCMRTGRLCLEGPWTGDASFWTFALPYFLCILPHNPCIYLVAHYSGINWRILQMVWIVAWYLKGNTDVREQFREEMKRGRASGDLSLGWSSGCWLI